MSKRNVIIKKIIKKGHGGHHGGSWKIAYADFVTAMMAFFMMLWLIQIVTDGQKKGIADYFSKNISLLKPKSSPKSSLSGSSSSHREKDSSSKNTKIQTDTIEKPPSSSDSKIKANADNKAATTNTKVQSDSKDKTNADNKSVSTQDVLVDPGKTEQKKFQDILKKIEMMFLKKDKLKPYMSNINLSIVAEGLKIQIFDNNERSMFPLGSHVLQREFVGILKVIAEVLQELTNSIEISGYTDARAYNNSKKYTNWELSTDRANAARRALHKNNISYKRFSSIIGKADSDPLITKDLLNPKNRRISIMLLREHPLTPDQMKSLQQSKEKLGSGMKP